MNNNKRLGEEGGECIFLRIMKKNIQLQIDLYQNKYLLRGERGERDREREERGGGYRERKERGSEIEKCKRNREREGENCILHLFCIVFRIYFVSIIFEILQIVLQ